VLTSDTAQTLPTMTEDQAREALAAAVAPAGWPLTLDGAAEVLTGLGFATDPDHLRRLMDLGQVPRVELLDARDLLVVAGVLRARREFIPGDDRHEHLLPRPWRDFYDLLAAGPVGHEQLAAACRGMDPRLLIVGLAEQPHREIREALAAQLVYVLARHGILV
jgi:hypothetical protein